MAGDDFDIAKEAAWAISNVCSGGTDAQVRTIASQPGLLAAYVKMSRCLEERLVVLSLESIERILAVGKADAAVNEVAQNNIYAEQLEECQGLDQLEVLQHHESQDVYMKAQTIIRVSQIKCARPTMSSRRVGVQGGLRDAPLIVSFWCVCLVLLAFSCTAIFRCR
jgi:hypothetical protein